MGHVAVEGVDSRLLDVGGGVKIGLTNRKAYDVPSLGDQFVNFGEHFKGVFGPESGEPLR
jgi:diaminopimelate decarboxylase